MRPPCHQVLSAVTRRKPSSFHPSTPPIIFLTGRPRRARCAAARSAPLQCGPLAYETDCWDVHASLGDAHGFVLLDVRAPQSFEEGHVPGAVSLPHGKINERNLAAYPPDTLFVVYCNPDAAPR